MNKRLLLFLTTLLLTGLVVLPAAAQEDEDATVPAEALAGPNGQFIDLDGVRLYVVVEGDPDGPPVMLLHGFGGSTFTWRDTIPALVDAGYRVIAYDRPPFGLSDKAREIDLSLAAQVERAAALMDALEIESAALVGHSAGGGVIGAFATTYPERVDALVFVAGAVNIAAQAAPEVEATAEANAQESESPLGGLFALAGRIDADNPGAANLLRGLLTRERFIDILSSAYGPGFEVTEDIADGYARILRVEGWETGLLALVTARDEREPIAADRFVEVVGEIPTAIIWGEADPWVPLRQGETLYQLLPDATFITYPGIGHLPMEEAIEQFNDDLVSFLEEVYVGG
ncbi:MAG: alpha/beta fold hydrolase [Chloroflexota bacterium]